MTVMAGRRRPVVRAGLVAVGVFALLFVVLFAYNYANAGGQSSVAGGPGCPPLPSASVDLYPPGAAAGADKIRVSPGDSSVSADGEGTLTFTITACYGPVKWSVSGPYYFTVHPKSGTLRTGQQVQVQASYSDPGDNTYLAVNPGDYVLWVGYNPG